MDLLNVLKLESTKFTLKSELGFDEADLVNLDSFRKEGKKEETIMMGIASDLLNAVSIFYRSLCFKICFFRI